MEPFHFLLFFVPAASRITYLARLKSTVRPIGTAAGVSGCLWSASCPHLDSCTECIPAYTSKTHSPNISNQDSQAPPPSCSASLMSVIELSLRHLPVVGLYGGQTPVRQSHRRPSRAPIPPSYTPLHGDCAARHLGDNAGTKYARNCKETCQFGNQNALAHPMMTGCCINIEHRWKE